MRIEGAGWSATRLPSAGPMPPRRAFRLELRSGPRRGVGLALPAPGSEAETARSIAALADSLPGREIDPHDPRPPELGPDLPVDPARAAGRAALDTALLDLAGQALGLPVHRLLGGAPPDEGLPVNALLPYGSAEAVLSGAAEALARGIRTVKIKIARAAGTEAELDWLERLRERHGDRLAIRADANGRLSAREAARVAARLARIGAEYLEQPVAPARLAALGPLDVPVAADESLQRPDAPALLRTARGLAVAVLKPAALGGPRASLALARVAQEAGLDVVVTHAFDGPIGFAAAAETALALDRPPLPCGLDSLPLALPAALPQAGDARIVPHDRPGLGLGGV